MNYKKYYISLSKQTQTIMKTALEKIHEAYRDNDLETAQYLHKQINQEEKVKELVRSRSQKNNLPPRQIKS